jgi:hypothetical protein
VQGLQAGKPPKTGQSADFRIPDLVKWVRMKKKQPRRPALKITISKLRGRTRNGIKARARWVARPIDPPAAIARLGWNFATGHSPEAAMANLRYRLTQAGHGYRMQRVRPTS